MAIRVAINGFGRIGRMFVRAVQIPENSDVEVVAINSLSDSNTLAHLLKYDSVHGRFPGEVSATETTMVINGKSVQVSRQRDPVGLPWGELEVDVVLEATGVFRHRDQAGVHVANGARKVLLSSPGKEMDATVVMGVNDDILTPEHNIVSNASCTTNCLAPIAMLLDDAFGIENGVMDTVHAYTRDQRLLDSPHKDLRRGRAGAECIVPTSTGAATNLGIVLPRLEGKLSGMALRVPVPNGSCIMLVANLTTATTAEAVNALLQEAAEGSMKGILAYNTEPIVHLDILGDSHSAIVDAPSTFMVGDRTLHLLAWYDNEAGYAYRCVDMARRIGTL